jgi:hypothetical protein
MRLAFTFLFILPACALDEGKAGPASAGFTAVGCQTSVLSEPHSCYADFSVRDGDRAGSNPIFEQRLEGL